MSEPTIKVDAMFGSIYLVDAPPRIEGDRLYPRTRSIHYDRYGNVTHDETFETGVCVLNWESCAHFFGVTAPKRTLWQRVRSALGF